MTNITVSVSDSSGATASAVATFTVSAPATGLRWTGRKGCNCWSPWGSSHPNVSSYTQPPTFDTKFPPVARANYKAAGFDFIRIALSIAPYCISTSTPAIKQSIRNTIIDGVSKFVASGVKVLIHLAPGGGDVPGWEATSDVLDSLTGPKFTAHCGMLADLTQALKDAGVGYDQVALGTFNELQYGSNTLYYPFIKKMWQTVRAVDPNRTIVISPSGFAGMFSYDSTIKASDFDANTIYDFHIYAPIVAVMGGGNYSLLRSTYLSYPPPSTGGAAAYQTALAQYVALGGKASDQNDGTHFEELICYFGQGVPGPHNGPQNGQWMLGWITQYMEKWRKAQVPAVSPAQILCGEFGMDAGANNPYCLPDDQEALLLRDMRKACETLGYIWDVHEYDYPSGFGFGSKSGLFNQTTFNLRNNLIGPALFG